MIKKPVQKLPSCAAWNVWIGSEVEGNVDINERTFFVRKLPEGWRTMAPFRKADPKINRFWFCSGFNEWSFVKYVIDCLPPKKVCVEVVLDGKTPFPPRDVLRRCRVYVKHPLPDLVLKTGDQFCVGLPYNDTAFTLSEGRTVTADLYDSDVFVA